MALDFKVKRTLRGISYPPELWNPVWLGPLEPAELGEMLDEPVVVEDVYQEAIAAWDGATNSNIVDKTLEFYTRLYLQDNILVKADRASMMASLEVRSPFLDDDIVEFARRIPYQYKLRHGQTKYILKKSLEGVVPSNVLYRKKKGFGVPLTRWFRSWPPADFEQVEPCYAKHGWVRTKLEEHRLAKQDHRLFLWCWLALNHHARHEKLSVS